jgi:dUTP pyrophosphatase
MSGELVIGHAGFGNPGVRVSGDNLQFEVKGCRVEPAPPSLKFLRLPHGEGLPCPSQATAGAAGLDICAAEDVTLWDDDFKMVATGFAVAIPEGFELQVRPRSGLAAKYGVTVLNTPGTIDSDYRGEIKIILINHSDEPFSIKRGDRIAQLVLAPVTRMPVVEVEELDTTERGTNGFGSTGL